VRERPENFRINYTSPFARGLVFAGLSGFYGTTHYHDSSQHSRHGELSGLSASQRWLWSDEIGRFYNVYDGSQQALLSNALDVPTLPVTMMAIAQNKNTGWERIFHSSSTNVYGCNVSGTYMQFASGGTQVEVGACGSAGASFNAYQTVMSTVTTNRWYTIIARINSMLSMEVFIDGVKMVGLLANRSSTYGGGTGIGRIGALNYNSVINYGHVWVSDVLMWGRALQDEEIAPLSNIVDRSLGGLVLPPRRRLWGFVFKKSSFNSIFHSTTSSKIFNPTFIR